jgi:hypothetical protein
MPQMRMATLSTKRKPTQTARAEEDLRKVSAISEAAGSVGDHEECGMRRTETCDREAAGTWETLPLLNRHVGGDLYRTTGRPNRNSK